MKSHPSVLPSPSLPALDRARLPVLAVSEPAPGVFLLRFERRWDFRCGQVLGLTTETAIPPRLYSIASGEDEDFYEVLFDLVPGGLLTPALARLRPGDRLIVTPPSGSFLDGPGPGAWMAVGTGLAPFLSMARSGLSPDKLLVHGARARPYFFFERYLSELLGERYVRCASREGGEGLYPGRLTTWLRSRSGPPAEGRVLLCGSAEMVVEVRDLLLAGGLPFASISGEIYF